MARHLDDNRLKAHFRERLYNERIEVNDLKWDDVATRLKRKKLAVIPMHKKAFWQSIAASVLILSLVIPYYFMSGTEGIPEQTQNGLTESISNPDLTDDPITKELLPLVTDKEKTSQNSNSQVFQEEPIGTQHSGLENRSRDDYKEENIDDALNVVSELTDVPPIVEINASSTLDRMHIQPLALLNEDNVRSVYTRVGSPGFNSVIYYVSDGHKQEKEFLTAIDHVTFSFRPVQRYALYTPTRSDLTYISSNNQPSVLSQNRFGIHSSLNVSFNVRKHWGLVTGISYLYQRNYFEYEAQNLLSSESNTLKINETSNHIGVSIGLHREVALVASFDPKIELYVEYLEGLGSGQALSDNILSLELGYSFALVEATSTQIRFKPVFSYSFIESEYSLYTSRPYWLGLQFSIARIVN